MTQNLIPTPRTDRNGRTQIRHMKPEVTADRGAGIPAPPSPAPPAAPTDAITDFTAAARGLVVDEAAAEALRLIAEDDPAMLPSATELLTTGVPRARAAVRAVLPVMMIDVENAIKKSKDPGISGHWTHLGASKWTGTSGRSRLSMVWAMAGVLDELDDDSPQNTMWWRRELDMLDKLDFALGSPTAPAEHETGTIDMSYRRGLAALRSVLVARGLGGGRMNFSDKADHFVYFVRWAGTHEDIAGVVRIATERKTFFGKTIQAVLDAEKDAAPAIRDGVL